MAVNNSNPLKTREATIQFKLNRYSRQHVYTAPSATTDRGPRLEHCGTPKGKEGTPASARSISSAMNQEVKLPSFLSSFRGAYREYMQFKDTFQILINTTQSDM